MTVDKTKFVRGNNLAASDFEFDDAGNFITVKTDALSSVGQAIAAAGGSGGSVVDASATQAGVVNLADDQVLGAGRKVIDGITIDGDADKISLSRGTTKIESYNSVTVGTNASAGMYTAPDAFGVAVGSAASAGGGDVAMGHGATAAGTDFGFKSAVAVGKGANASHGNGTALGNGAATTKDNQVVLGNGSVVETVTNGALKVGGTSGSVGTVGQVLTSAGPDVPPTWETLSGGGGTVVDASATEAGIVNLVDGQELGAGAKVIDGISIGSDSAGDMYVDIVTTSATPSIVIGKGSNDSIANTGAVVIGVNAHGDGGVAIGHNANSDIGPSGSGLGVSIGKNSQAGGSDRTAIGPEAKANHPASTALGVGAETTKNNQVVLGGFFVTETVTNGALMVGGTSGSVGTVGQVLMSAGPGLPPTWETSSGGGSVVDASDSQAGIVNLVDGQVLGSGSKVVGNVKIGQEYMSGGGGSLRGHVNVGYDHVAIGNDATINGEFDVVIGGTARSYAGNSSGSVVVGIGAVSGQIGDDFKADNVAVGASAQALNQSVAVGSNASASHSNAIAIGYIAATTANNQVVLGNSAITSLRCQVTSITSLSDERDKKDWAHTIPGVEFLKELDPGYFTWNTRDGAKVGVRAAGFSAQKLLAAQEKFDAAGLDLVSTDNPDKLEARYGNLIPVLVQSIINQQAEIDALKKLLQG